MKPAKIGSNEMFARANEEGDLGEDDDAQPDEADSAMREKSQWSWDHICTNPSSLRFSLLLKRSSFHQTSLPMVVICFLVFVVIIHFLVDIVRCSMVKNNSTGETSECLRLLLFSPAAGEHY